MQIHVNRKAVLWALPVTVGLLLIATIQATVALAIAAALGVVLELLVWRPWPWRLWPR